MSEAVQVFHGEPSIESLADEIVSQRKSRKSKLPWHSSEYRGIKSNSNRVAKKYSDHEYDLIFGIRTRRLSPIEASEFRAHVQRCVDPSYVVVEHKTRKAVV